MSVMDGTSQITSMLRKYPKVSVEERGQVLQWCQAASALHLALALRDPVLGPRLDHLAREQPQAFGLRRKGWKIGTALAALLLMLGLILI